MNHVLLILFYGQVLKLNNEHKKFIIPNLNLNLYTEYLSRYVNTLEIKRFIEMKKMFTSISIVVNSFQDQDIIL